MIHFSSFIYVLDNSQIRPITAKHNNNNNNNNVKPDVYTVSHINSPLRAMADGTRTGWCAVEELVTVRMYVLYRF
jgi:hypothetical protein